MSWVIRAFEKEGDALVLEIGVDEVLRATFRELVGAPESDPMFDSYPLSEEALKRLEALFDLELQRPDVVYFIDYHR
jgi:hypothetical protein